ncbi:MAG: cation-transporting P-type ATPase, partial [Magnetospirillum sp.]|nr:cation-transporting P-type ATPase [Magnetospirillum sp.]
MIVPIHTAVPGRVRARVSGLEGNPEQARRLAAGLAVHPAIVAVSANAATGTVLVRFEPGVPLPEILAAIDGGRAAAPRASWQSLAPDQAVRRLDSDGEAGLSRAEARRRLLHAGPNRLPIPRRRAFAAILRGQLASLPVAVLSASALLSLLTGGAFEGLAILTVVGVNALIGAGSESQAEHMIARLESRRRPLAIVRRDGRRLTVAAEEVVPGDLLELSPGLTVAADARLLRADALLADESVLTGESLPVVKDPAARVAATAPLAEQTTLVWRGTLIAGGSGMAAVVATGRHTEIGRLQALIGDVARPQTPLQRRLDGLGRRLVLGSGAVALLMVALGVLRGQSLGPLLKAAAALAVAAIPEGLPTVATLALAVAVDKLERRGVLVRRLEAVEGLGTVATVFFDKTGTLTLNRMAVAAVSADGAAARDRLWTVAALCSDAGLQPDGAGGWTLEGSSTECALLRAALDHRIDVAALRSARPRLSERYRDDRRQSMATVHADGGERRFVAVKGSPAEVLAACNALWSGEGAMPLGDAARAAIAADNEALAARGLRVLGFACGEDAEGPLTWLGLVGLSDPLRPGVAAFVAGLHRSGVETVMLTGDQAATAQAVARELGLIEGEGMPVADAGEVERLDAESLATLAARTRVFARILPGHKLKVVQAYRRGGRVVAMVGDGINDGPALKAADIGVTMGRQGSRAARDLSDVVLEEDDLDGLLAAIAEGRAATANIRKAVEFLLATNLSESLAMVAATALGLGQPLGPTQLLWINLVTDVLPGIALVREPVDPATLRVPASDGPFLDPPTAGRLVREGAVLAAGPLAAYAWGRRRGAATASTLAASTIVGGQMLHALAVRPRRRAGGEGNPWFAAAIG